MTTHENAPGAACQRPEGEDPTTDPFETRGDVSMSIAPLPPLVHRPPRLDPVDAAGIVDGAYVVVVKTDQGRYRRRPYLSLSSAEKAAERARARGHGAEVVLCRLAPVTGWTARDAAVPAVGDAA